MASIASNPLTIHGLANPQASALRKKAERLGVTAEDYVRELIAMDLEQDRMASAKSFAELSLPFQGALAGLSDEDLDTLSRPSRPKARR